MVSGLSPEHGAGRIEEQRDFAVRPHRRARRPGRPRRPKNADAELARQRLINRLDRWVDQRKHVTNLRKTLVYERVNDEAKYDPLMMSPENARAAMGDPGRAAVRRRQLHARGPAGDQPARQPDRRAARLHGAARAHRSGSSGRRAHREPAALDYIYDETQAVNPLGDAEQAQAKQAKHNRAKVGSGRPVQPALYLRPRRDHGSPPVHDHADRARRLGSDLASPRRRAAADPRATAARGGPAVPALAPDASSAPTPGSRSGSASRPRATTSACPPACSRSGCAAPAATCSACSPSSAIPTPTRSAPTWPASST